MPPLNFDERDYDDEDDMSPEQRKHIARRDANRVPMGDQPRLVARFHEPAVFHHLAAHENEPGSNEHVLDAIHALTAGGHPGAKFLKRALGTTLPEKMGVKRPGVSFEHRNWYYRGLPEGVSPGDVHITHVPGEKTHKVTFEAFGDKNMSHRVSVHIPAARK